MDNIEELSKVGLFENLIDYRNFNSLDACGRVFDYGDHIYRGIFEDSKELAESYFSSGLLSKLEEKGLFPRTIKTNYFLKDYALILEHEKVGNLSYVYEWSFEMIKDAAILVLDVLDTVTDYGFTLKDAHPYNIMFHNNRPVWVDLTSLVQGETLGNWPLIELYKSITQPLEFMAINPEATLTVMCEYLNIPYSETLLKAMFCGKLRVKDGDNMGGDVQSGYDTKPVFRANNEYFSYFDKYRLEMMMDKFMELYGYKRKYYDGQKFSAQIKRALMEFPFLFEQNFQMIFPPEAYKKIRNQAMTAYVDFAISTTKVPFTIKYPNGKSEAFSPIPWLYPDEKLLRTEIYS